MGYTYEALSADGKTANIHYSYALESVKGTNKLELKQRVNKCEVLTCNCWESRNKYDVYNEDGSQLFRAVESTGCCMRYVARTMPDCAGWTLDMNYVGSILHKESGAFKMERPCTYCTFLCINRPMAKITNSKDETLGYVRDPCALCPMNMSFEVKDQNEETMYTASSGFCQWGICCPLPCGPCKTVEFPIYETSSGNEVGLMQKKTKNCFKTLCCSFCFDDTENYTLTLEGIPDLRSRILLMSLAIFLDFRYFQNNEDDANATGAADE